MKGTRRGTRKPGDYKSSFALHTVELNIVKKRFSDEILLICFLVFSVCFLTCKQNKHKNHPIAMNTIHMLVLYCIPSSSSFKYTTEYTEVSFSNPTKVLKYLVSVVFQCS